MLTNIYFAFLLYVTAAKPETKDNSETKVNASFTDEKRIANGYTINIVYANFYVYLSCPHLSCGGTLVRQNKVITAAHCVNSCNFHQIDFTVGLNSLSEFPRAKKYKAISIKKHPKYHGDRDRIYDVAVVTLKQNVKLNYRVGTISYAQVIPPVGAWLCIYGYGYINLHKESPNNLQKGATNVIKVQESLITTDGRFGANVLPGDSGGPVLYNNQLVAVISGYRHHNNTPLSSAFVAIAHPKIWKFIRKYAP